VEGDKFRGKLYGGMEMKAVRFVVNMSRCKGVSRNSKGWKGWKYKLGPMSRSTIDRI
jgi:hypothetical protein